MLQEIKQLEQNLQEQDQFYHQQRKDVAHADEAVKKSTLKALRQKELDFVAKQAASVSKIKKDKEKLERQRLEIMRQLEAIKEAGSRGTYRGNKAAIDAGNRLMQEKPRATYQQQFQTIDPSMHEKLLSDQARLDQLKLSQYHPHDPDFQPFPEFDERPKGAVQRPEYRSNPQPQRRVVSKAVSVPSF